MEAHVSRRLPAGQRARRAAQPAWRLPRRRARSRGGGPAQPRACLPVLEPRVCASRRGSLRGSASSGRTGDFAEPRDRTDAPPPLPGCRNRRRRGGGAPAHRMGVDPQPGLRHHRRPGTGGGIPRTAYRGATALRRDVCSGQTPGVRTGCDRLRGAGRDHGSAVRIQARRRSSARVPWCRRRRRTSRS